VLAQEIIRRKRDGKRLDGTAIEALIGAIADGTLGEAQIAAFAMAVFLRGMDADECVGLTRSMAHSGEVLDWRGAALDGPVLDKHSTGGVGDKVSLILAPLLAACGAYVPMISGRGLGHTGGTVDKLEAIPGYTCAVDLQTVQRVVVQTGCAIVGAGPALAPADRRLYAVRDVTATVESIPLITASILSKKLAEGLDVLVMDVKTGSGAFALTLDEARELAASIARVARGAGLETSALITDMGQVLGHAAGNAVEVTEAIAFLRGDACEARLEALVLALGEEALVRGGLAADPGTARVMLRRALEEGRAAERFGAMVTALGGPADLVDRHAAVLPRAPVVRDVAALSRGFVGTIDVRALGLAIVELGAGRSTPGASVDPRVGLTQALGPGARVDHHTALAQVHARNDAAAERAERAVRAAYGIVDAPPAPVGAVVIERLLEPDAEAH
jgi:thymidine phosphorylase